MYSHLMTLMSIILIAQRSITGQAFDEPQIIPFHTLIKCDSRFQRSEPGFIILRGPGDEARFLDTFFPRPDFPEVDYFSQMVVGICGGLRSMTGHSIKIDQIIRQEGVVVVYYTDFRPTAGFAYPSWPIHLVIVPKTKLPIEFRCRIVNENERNGDDEFQEN